MDVLTEHWPIVVGVCGVIAAVVVFGSQLADLIIKWNQVLRLRDRNGGTVLPAVQASGEIVGEQVLTKNAFSARSISLNSGNIKKYKLSKDGVDLEYREVLKLWEQDEDFLDFYLSIFKQCGFDSYVWETPPVSLGLLSQKYEFVLVNNPKSSSTPDYNTYKEYFNPQGMHSGVVVFPNLGHDAVLVVPSPLRTDANYSGLAEFYTESPVHQQYSLWRLVAKEIRMKVSEDNIWVSVAGGGISWLHIRIDTIPKYYRYLPYAE